MVRNVDKPGRDIASFRVNRAARATMSHVTDGHNDIVMHSDIRPFHRCAAAINYRAVFYEKVKHTTKNILCISTKTSRLSAPIPRGDWHTPTRCHTTRSPSPYCHPPRA